MQSTTSSGTMRMGNWLPRATIGSTLRPTPCFFHTLTHYPREMKPATRTTMGPPSIPDVGAPYQGRKNAKQKNRKRAKRKPKNREQLDSPGYEIVRSRKLLESLYKGASIFQGKDVSLLHHGSRTKTGWYGKRPPPFTRAEIRARYEEGTIGELLVDFTRIPYTL